MDLARYTLSASPSVIAQRVPAMSLLVGALLFWTGAFGGLTANDSLQAAQQVALAAVEGDSADRVRARLSAALADSPDDPGPALALGYLSLFQYDFPEATRRFRGLRVDPGRPLTVQAYSALALAQTALAQGRAAEADSLLADAAHLARAAGLRLLQAEALVLRVLTTNRVHGLVAAKELLVGTERLLTPLDSALGARAVCVRAQLTRSWDLEEALTIALRGAALARVPRGQRTEAFCLGVAGWAVAQRGDIDSALVLFDRAARIQERARDRSGRAATLQWRGYFLHDVGSYGAARVMLAEAIREGEAAGNMSPVAWAHANLALLTFATGELDESAFQLVMADSLFTSQGDQFGLSVLAGIRVQQAREAGDTALAQATAERFRRESGRWGGIWPIEAHRAQAHVALDRARWAPAAAHLDSAMADARALAADSYLPSVAQDLGILALRRGDPAGARRILERLVRALPKSQAVYRHYTRTQLASAYLRSGEVALAAQTAMEAAVELDQWRSTVDDRRLLQAAYDIRPYEDPSFAVADIIAELAAAGLTVTAFDLAERRRARRLLDRMVLLKSLDPDQSAQAISRSPVATLAEVAAALPDESTAIIEYVRGREDGSTTVFVVTRTTHRAVQLPPIPGLGRSVQRFARLLEAGAPGDSLAADLGTALLGPVLAELPPGVRRLIVVPDLELHGLPFDALTVHGRSVLEQFTISYAPSASVMVLLWGRPRSAGPVAVLAIGDPTFVDQPAPGSPAEVHYLAFQHSGGLGRLRGSAREARATARYGARGDVWLRTGASEAALKGDGLERYRVIHLATHALVDDRSVAHTSLALAPGGGEDGFLSPSELAGLRLAADLVVLSACRTGQGLVVGGEGIQGLAAPALEAGARSVVGSAWNVGDGTTADFINRFYSAMAGGLPVDEAMRFAKLEARRAGISPTVWAGFAVVGDGGTTVPLGNPRGGVPHWWYLAVAAMVIGAVWRLRRTGAVNLAR